MELSGCLPFSTPWLEEISAATMSLSDTISLCADEIPTILVVPLAFWTESSRADSSSIVEDSLLLLQTLALKLRGASVGTTRHIFCWTDNAEGLWVDDTEEGASISTNEYSTLVGGSVRGLMRFALLEIDAAMLRMVCIDTDHPRINMDSYHQVLRELHLTDDPKLFELEVSYRGNTCFVRRLRKIARRVW